MIPFPVLERAAQRTASLRSLAGEISDLYCDVAATTTRLAEMQAGGTVGDRPRWSAEAIGLARERQSEALLALGLATERLLKLTEAPR